MKTTLSSKGQVVLPRPIREAAGFENGDVFLVKLSGKKVILEKEEITPAVVGTRKLKNGLMVFDVPADAPKLTTDMVKKLENEAV